MLSVKIKSETHTLHRRLESHRLFAALNGAFDRQQYTFLLSKLYPFYQGLEKQYVSQLDSIPELAMEQRQRALLLKSDLEKLGASVCWEEKEQQFVPSLRNRHEAIGALYVIEGSTLGAKYISQSLLRSGIGPSSGALYFAGYGEQTGFMWKRFLNVLDRAAVNEEEEKMVIASANNVFEKLYEWLEN